MLENMTTVRVARHLSERGWRYLPRYLTGLGLTLCFFALANLMPHRGLGLFPRALAASTGPTIEVEFQSGLVTVNAKNATVAQVLRTIAANLGFEISIYGALHARTITRPFVARPLFEVLQDLLKHQNWAMLYDAPQGGGKIPGHLKLWVYGKQSAISPAHMPLPEDARGSGHVARSRPNLRGTVIPRNHQQRRQKSTRLEEREQPEHCKSDGEFPLPLCASEY